MKFSSTDSFRSRRSPVVSLGGAVASSQPIATQAGVEILRAGGTAADAAVAAAAALQVTQPCSTGLGGDAFCLYYEAESGRVHALNGSGRSPAQLDLNRATRAGFSGRLPAFHAHTVTVPGAAAAWEETISRFGTLPLATVIEPARRLAERGFPVAPLTSSWWSSGVAKQLSKSAHGHELCLEAESGLRAPQPGEAFRNRGLASVLARLGEHGARELYEGETAERIVEAVREAGGLLSAEDLRAHRSEWVDPISVDYRGVKVWECPPNGQGFAALSALNVLSNLDPREFCDPNRVHLLVESMRLGFADAERVVADPDMAGVAKRDYESVIAELLSSDYGKRRAALINPVRAMQCAEAGDPARALQPASPGGTPAGSDTVYLSTTDRWGNGCSFINSNFMGFGTGIVPRGCGFSLHNRGHSFSLEEGHPNALSPGKRPFHTLVPGLATTASGDGGGDDLFAVFGVMGGMMQPQGHLQVISSLVDFDLDPQASLDRIRFQLDEGLPNGTLLMEDDGNDLLGYGLSALGHEVKMVTGFERHRFGLGQIICRTPHGFVAGSDGRGDGVALTDDPQR